MRKIVLIAAATIGGLIIVAAGLIVYGALNLNAIVKRDQRYVLDKLSYKVGRGVQAQDIQIGLGWGVTLDISGLQIADDPAFSQLPFLKAKQVSGQVELLPLISGRILITRLAMLNPEVRILRDRAGRLNVGTLGAHQGAPTPGPPARPHPPAGGLPITFLVRDLNIHEGGVSYQDAAGGRPIEAGHVNLDINDVSPDAAISGQARPGRDRRRPEFVARRHSRTASARRKAGGDADAAVPDYHRRPDAAGSPAQFSRTQEQDSQQAFDARSGHGACQGQGHAECHGLRGQYRSGQRTIGLPGTLPQACRYAFPDLGVRFAAADSLRYRGGENQAGGSAGAPERSQIRQRLVGRQG